MLLGILMVSDNYLTVAQKRLKLTCFRDLYAEIKYLIWLLKDKYKLFECCKILAVIATQILW